VCDLKAGLVVSTVVIRNGKLLMVQEGKAPAKGCWNLPSGRLESNERITEGAIRETFEETGYSVSLIGLTGIYIFDSETGTRLIRFNFKGEVIGGEPVYNHEEILAVKWFDFDDVNKMDDSEIWNAKSVREILNDVKAEKNYSVELLRDLF